MVFCRENKHPKNEAVVLQIFHAKNLPDLGEEREEKDERFLRLAFLGEYRGLEIRCCPRWLSSVDDDGDDENPCSMSEIEASPLFSSRK